MKTRYTCLLATCLLVFACPTVWASQAPTSTPTPWYQVEIIVFTHPLENDNAVREEFTPINWHNPSQHPIELSDIPTNTNQRLPEDAFQLTQEMQQLQHRQGYQVRLHIAWKQPGLDAKTAPLIHMTGGQAYLPNGQLIPTLAPEPPASLDHHDTPMAIDAQKTALPTSTQSHPLWEIEGVIKIAKGHYFNLSTALRFLQPHDSFEAFEDNTPMLADQTQAMPPGFSQVTLKQSRRMRSNQLNYLDHPQLGVLVKITPTSAPVLPLSDASLAQTAIQEASTPHA